MRSKHLGIAATAALGTIGLAAIPTAGTATAATSCTPATNIEAIIDDSGSMMSTDANNLRTAGLKLLINKPGNAKKTLGAVAFGTDASRVFQPLLIGNSIAAMSAVLDGRVKDDGATYYTKAFALAGSENPGANARIFLTDGEPTDAGNGWQGGPKTYTVGLGLSAGGSGEALLKQIATGTGGAYVRADTDATLQAAINDIDAYLNCNAVPKRYTDTFVKNGSKSHTFSVTKATKSVDLALTWSSPTDALDVIGVTQSTGGKASAAKKKKVKVKKHKGSTFVNLHITNVKKGKLKFKVRLKQKASLGAVTATTQATRSRKK